jgi:hypothetical protein
MYSSKAVEAPSCCETSRLSHFLDNRLTVGGENVILTRPVFLYTQADSWYSFMLEAEWTLWVILRLDEFGKLKNQMASGIEPETFDSYRTASTNYTTTCLPGFTLINHLYVGNFMN